MSKPTPSSASARTHIAGLNRCCSLGTAALKIGNHSGSRTRGDCHFRNQQLTAKGRLENHLGARTCPARTPELQTSARHNLVLATSPSSTPRQTPVCFPERSQVGCSRKERSRAAAGSPHAFPALPGSQRRIPERSAPHGPATRGLPEGCGCRCPPRPLSAPAPHTLPGQLPSPGHGRAPPPSLPPAVKGSPERDWRYPVPASRARLRPGAPRLACGGAAKMAGGGGGPPARASSATREAGRQSRPVCQGKRCPEPAFPSGIPRPRDRDALGAGLT